MKTSLLNHPLLSALAAGVMILAGALAAGQQQAPRPNAVIILADKY